MPIMNRFLLRNYRKELIALFAFLSAYTYTSTTVIRTYKVPVNCEWIVHVFLLQQHLSLHKNLIKTLVSFNFPCFPWRDRGRTNEKRDWRTTTISFFRELWLLLQTIDSLQFGFLWFDFFLSNKKQPIFWRLSMHFRIVNYCGLLFIWMKLD